MATAEEARDHETIKKGIENRGGQPAQVRGTGSMLRIEFDKDEENRAAI